MSWLSNLFGGGGDKNSPMNSANQYLNQIPGIGHEGYDDYINKGKTAGDTAQTEYDQMTKDPAGFINKLMEQYKTSEGYNFKKGQLEKEMGNTAAAGGIAGTPMDQMNQAQGVQGLLSQDMQEFLSNVLGQHKEGLAGEEGVANRGYDASKNLTDTLGNALNQQGGLAFNNQQQKNKNKNDIWSMFGKGLGAAAGSFLGPIGTAAGTAVGGKLFGGH